MRILAELRELRVEVNVGMFMHYTSFVTIGLGSSEHLALLCYLELNYN